ncbi:MAG: C45 family peptidase, partial [Bacteroidales bacterium]|nr:C45 family peptidase [Bacteroidales bacterium]
MTSFNIHYICVANAGYSNIPWMGVNEYGFAILNSLTYDLTGGSGPGNGTVMRYALGNCVTIDDFQDYLDSTNITGRNTRANFAVIDSNSNAAIFEVGGNEYWKFNAEDEPDGYIIRTNFTVNGSGSTGIQRYNRSSALISDFYAGDSLNYRSLLRHQMRDFSDYNSQPYPVPLLEKLYPWANWGYFPTNYALCNNISVSASVI